MFRESDAFSHFCEVGLPILTILTFFGLFGVGGGEAKYVCVLCVVCLGIRIWKVTLYLRYDSILVIKGGLVW